MIFPPKCRTKKLGMKNTILGSFAIFIWEGADMQLQIMPRKIPVYHMTSRLGVK